MDGFVVVLIFALVVLIRTWGLPNRLTALQKELAQRLADQKKLQEEVQLLQVQVARLRDAKTTASPFGEPVEAARTAAPLVAAFPVAAPASPTPPLPVPLPEASPAPAAPVPAPPMPMPEPTPAPASLPSAEPAPAPILAQTPKPAPGPASIPIPTPETEPVAEPLVSLVLTTKPEPEVVLAPEIPPKSEASPEPELTPDSAPEPTPEPNPESIPEPAPQAEPLPIPAPRPAPLLIPEPLPLAAAVAVERPIFPPVAPPPPVPTGPSWWERAATLLLENWTGILGAVVLVTGVGFLGIYAALRVAPPLRFLMICAFSAGLLGARFALRNKEFARQLNGWLLSSAAAIFLFACVGSVSIAGLRWATPPFDYLLLLAGVSANLWLAWRSSRQEVSTLHGVLSLVALAVLPPTALTLAAAAGVTAFSIAITYRQLWKYQLLLSIISFFAFHLYWHQELAVISNTLRLVAMGLVLLVGVAAAVVQYRSVYAKRTFEPLLFTAHLLNWTCLGINLYLYSTGSIWKTIPLALGALLTFWAGRKAKQLGIGWLFQTDTIISLMLALATAFSLQGWHTNNSVILLFMLLESLLVALIMARQSEALVYRVAMSGACLAAGGLLLLAGSKLEFSPPHALYRDAFVLGLAGWAGLAFVRFICKQPLLSISPTESGKSKRNLSPEEPPRNLLNTFAGAVGLLQAGAGIVLARVLFAWADTPAALLIGALLVLAGGALGLAAWLRTERRVPEWIRQQQLLLAQFFALLAVFGLHEMDLTWPVLLGLLYAENLVVALLASRWRETLLYQTALGDASLAGAALLLVAADKASAGLPSELYRDALVLALCGWASIVFTQFAHRQLTVRPAPGITSEKQQHAGSVGTAERSWLGGIAGLGGLLQVGAGLLLTRVLFGWQAVPVWLLLGALLALAGAALGLAAWLRQQSNAPTWVRQQQLIISQLFTVLAVVGLHETGLSWPVVLGLLYAENLVATLLAARQREPLLYHITLTGAYLTGTSVLLITTGKMASSVPATLYRDALVLALTGWAGIIFSQLAHRQLLRPDKSTAQELNLTEVSSTDHDLLSGFAGLAGLLQAGTGALLARVVFAWQHAPVGLLLIALIALAGIALGLAGWVRAQGYSAAWVRRQQLVLAQFFAVLAILGLHEIGLTWPAVLFILYAENLLVALLLNGRNEETLLHLQIYLVVVQAALLPLLISHTAPETLGLLSRAGLLTGAALLTVGYQLRQYFLPNANEEFFVIPLSGTLRLPALGLEIGWLLLSAGALVYERPWAAWAMVGLLGGLLFLRQRLTVPGLWAGLILAAGGYIALQWGHVLAPPAGQQFSPGYVLLYLLPTLAIPLAGLRTSWWVAGNRYLRWPWLYLLALHLVVALVAGVPKGHIAYFTLGLLALAVAAFVAAQLWRRDLPDEAAVRRAGTPDRFLLHVAYWLLGCSVATHLWLITLNETFFSQPAEYFTAAALFVGLAVFALTPPPATAPVYNSWRILHPWLPEATLLFGTATLWHNIRTPWLALVWVSAALALSYLAAQIPLRLRRLGVYGRLYYWLAAGTASVASILYISPGQLLSPTWWEITTAVALLFGYVGMALEAGPASYAGLSPAWDALARPPRRVLEAWLLYPAFLALALLLIQSFDHSVLTVLLMVEVVAVFSTSLLLRRQDLRYLSLIGMLGCLVRLVFFDLSKSGTITRAIVFIFMGLLLLGMNALYARFKSRFAPDEAQNEEPNEASDEEEVFPEPAS